MKYSDLSNRSRLRSTWFKFASASLIALAVAGCGGGSDGAAGPQGPQGPVSTVPGPVGPDLVNVVKVAALTPDQWISMKWSAQITSASVGADGKPVVNFKVLDEKSNPVVGLANTTYSTITNTAIAPSYTNFGFSFAKLVPATVNAPSHWVSYIVTTAPTYKSSTDHTDVNIVPAAQSKPTTDNQGTMVDHGDGSYTYTFFRSASAAKSLIAASTDTSTKIGADLGDLTYDATLTHRVAVAISGAMPGTGTNTPDGITVKATVSSTNPVAATFDFRPDGAAMTAGRTITSMDKCQSCHAGALLHGRKDPNLCVTCHTAQTIWSRTPATMDPADSTGMTYKTAAERVVEGGVTFSNFDLPRWIHKIHMGEGLIKKNYMTAKIDINDVAYPQDQRNCAKCHTASTATPQGDAWKTNPSRLACGSCHDGINFSDGSGTALNGLTTGHLAGKGYADDAKCSTCHEAADIAAYHVPVTPINADVKKNNVAAGYTNYSSIAAYTSNLPVGAIAISYDINAVSVDSSKHAVVKFRILQNGARADFNTFGAGKTEIYDNFVGAPSVYVVFGATQDGISAPADFNASVSASIKKLWNGTATSGTGAGTLSVTPDANGYYTATLTGVTIPATAKMVTAGIGYTYASTLPLTQTNLAKYPYDAGTTIGGLTVEAPNAWMVATGSTSRRILVENARCNTCHEKLGVFTEAAFHAGQRNDAQSCNFCHNPDKSSSGWAANASTFIHGIHAGGTTSTTLNPNQPVAGLVASSKGLTNIRTTLYSWENNLAAGVGYPGGIKNCQACHLPDVVNYGTIYTRSSNSDLTPVQSSVASLTSGTGYLPFVDNMLNSTVANGLLASGATTVLSPDVVSGITYGAAPAVSALGVVTVDGANLVTTPIAAACSSCHDTAKAKTHMTDNHGLFYVTRTVANAAAKENCLVCHGAGKAVDAQAVHQ